MKKGALVKLIDVNGEERGHGLFMDSFIPAERGLTVYDMITNGFWPLWNRCSSLAEPPEVAAQLLRQDKQSYDTQVKHFEVFIDGNVKFLNAICWSLLPVPDV